jgi:hypothetical protein
MKLFFIIVEVALAIGMSKLNCCQLLNNLLTPTAFGTLSKLGHWNSAAVTEWVIALVYSVFVASFIIDFLPATKTRAGSAEEPMTMDQAVTNGSNGAGYDYSTNRTMGQAIRDTKDNEHTQHGHRNGVNGTNGHTVNGTTAPHF